MATKESLFLGNWFQFTRCYRIFQTEALFKNFTTPYPRTTQHQCRFTFAGISALLVMQTWPPNSGEPPELMPALALSFGILERTALILS